MTLSENEKKFKTANARLVEKIARACLAATNSPKCNYDFWFRFSGYVKDITVYCTIKDRNDDYWSMRCWVDSYEYRSHEDINTHLALILNRIKHTVKLPAFKPVLDSQQCSSNS